MREFDLIAAHAEWHPIASATDLQPRFVHHAQLLGREFAVWRADDGNVNVWENRCLHRGVRLSIGINDGRELVCQYHGWRYANGTAGCTYIPAHPADAPARTICNTTYAVIERHGLIWTKLPAFSPKNADSRTAQSESLWVGNDSMDSELDEANLLILRPLPVNAPLKIVAKHLQGSSPTDTSLENSVEKLSVVVCAQMTTDCESVVYFLQPVDSDRTIIRGVELSSVCEESSEDDRPQSSLQKLRKYNSALELLREKMEAQALTQPLPPKLVVEITPVSEALASMPDLQISGRKAPLRVKVDSIVDLAGPIRVFDLVSISGQLPTFQPGAHVDVHLSNGMIKQYSLINGPGQTDRYRIAVKLEKESSGGSAFMHHHVRMDDVLALSVPRNNFPLRRDATQTLLIGGGIGITPLLAMAKALQHQSLSFKLVYFAGNADEVVEKSFIESLGSSAVVEDGLTVEQTLTSIENMLQSYKSDNHLYVCGPGPMLESTRAIAKQNLWPDEAVHFEYFSNNTRLDSSTSFDVSLSRSGMTLTVPPGKSVLEVLRESGVDLPSSCEQGACGTCKVGVLKGVPLHQDVFLSQTERDRGDCMMTCVSRAESTELVLDI